MKPSKKEFNNKKIIYKYRAWMGVPCDYCGIMAFSHVHPPNTAPRDFERPEYHIADVNKKVSKKELVDALVRDACKVNPMPKSEMRRRIEEIFSQFHNNNQDEITPS